MKECSELCSGRGCVAASAQVPHIRRMLGRRARRSMAAEGDATKGVGLHLHGMLHRSGDTLRCLCKAFSCPPQVEKLKWELRYILPKAGWAETPTRKLWAHMSDNWPRWEAAVAMLGLQPHRDHLDKSRAAIMKQRSSEVRVALRRPSRIGSQASQAPLPS